MINISTDMSRALRDAVFGLAVGDALGVPYEGCERGGFACTGMAGPGVHGMPAGTWSDDTSLTLATCDSIRLRRMIDLDDLRIRFEAWLHMGSYTIDGESFGVGATTQRALLEGQGQRGEWDNGNGSLMRMAPLAFCGASDDEIRDVSAITHAHRVSFETCVDYVHVLREAQVDPCGLRDRLACLQGSRPRRNVRSTGFVRDTYDAALWCVGTTNSLEECLLAAVNLGDDTDTIAAVAGALAGVLYGAGSIPPKWMRSLRGKDEIEACLF